MQTERLVVGAQAPLRPDKRFEPGEEEIQAGNQNQQQLTNQPTNQQPTSNNNQQPASNNHGDSQSQMGAEPEGSEVVPVSRVR